MDLQFFRSSVWQDFFDYLDHVAGFYEFRWGDALVRTMGVELFLEQHEIHLFKNIAYSHGIARNDVAGCDYPYTNLVCPDGICVHCTWKDITFRGVDADNLPKFISIGVAMVCGFLTTVYLLIRGCRKVVGGQSVKMGQE